MNKLMIELIIHIYFDIKIELKKNRNLSDGSNPCSSNDM